MRVLDRAEFAAARRGAQDTSIARLEPLVREALGNIGDENWWRTLLAPVRDLFNSTLRTDSGGDRANDVRAWGRLSKMLGETLPKTAHKDDTTVTAIATYLTTAALNAAAIAAARADREPLVMEWVTMHDKDVREAHTHTDGQRRPPGEPFSVDGYPMAMPGDTSAPIELWINCRCMVRPALASEAASLSGVEAFAADDAPPTHRVVVALPSDSDPASGIGEDPQGVPKHMTLVNLGKPEENPDLDMDAVRDHVSGVADQMQPWSSDVSSVAPLGEDGAMVWLCPMDDDGALTAHEHVNDGPVHDGYQAVQQFPQFVPHVTIAYADEPPEGSEDIASIAFDRLAVWDGEDRQEYPLGGEPMTTTTDAAAVAGDDIGQSQPLAWHGVLAPEGVWSGDGRMFAEDSLRFRDLPVPLTWQKISDDGHKSSVVVAKIEQINRVNGQMRGRGHWLAIPEADEAIGLVSEFGKFGVSIDADDGQFDFDEESGRMTFTSARIASACLVPIPAFAEAFVSMGPAPDNFMIGDDTGDSEDCDPNDPNYDECMRARGNETGEDTEGDDSYANGVAEFSEALLRVFKRGPGWVTNPADTKRIHDYWTVPGEEGYAKVGWNSPGDFNRCRVLVGEKIAENSPEDTRFLNQICAQWHHDATGFWPGHAPAEQALRPEGEMAPSISLVASAGRDLAPAEWFADPHLTGPTPLTITEDGRVFGHLAQWGTCHTGFPGACVTAPHSLTDYAYFLTGAVRTDAGLVPVGQLTVGGGHADSMLSMRKAMAHYDTTSTVVCDIAVGEDDHGIWMAGRVRPGVEQAKVDELLAASVSGDWREKFPGDLDYELVAALGVNSPGFVVPRVGIRNGAQISLVAAGVVQDSARRAGQIDLDVLANQVADVHARRRQRMAALAAKVSVEG